MSFSNIVENSILKKHLSFAKNSKVICLIPANISFKKKTQLIDITTKPEHIY